jgi:hypothetical protein
VDRGISCHQMQTNFGAYPAPSRYATSAPSQRIKLKGRDSDHSLPSSAEVMNVWRYTSTTIHVFTARCVVEESPLPLPSNTGHKVRAYFIAWSSGLCQGRTSKRLDPSEGKQLRIEEQRFKQRSSAYFIYDLKSTRHPHVSMFCVHNSDLLFLLAQKQCC